MQALYEKAMQSAGMAAWAYQFSDRHLAISPFFFTQTGISPDTVSALTDFMSLCDEDSQRNMITQIRQISSSKRQTLDCSPTIHTPRGVFTLHMIGTIDTSEATDRKLVGTIHFDVEEYTHVTGQYASESPPSGLPSVEYIDAFSWLLDSLNAYIWFVDFFGEIQYCNRAAARFRPLKLVKGKPFATAVTFFDDPDRQQRELLKVIHTGEPMFSSREIVTIDESQYWFGVDIIPSVDRNGNTTGAVVILNDVTKETKGDEELRADNALYEAFFSASSDLIWCYEVNPPVDINLPIQQQLALIDKHARLVECNQHYAMTYGKDNPTDLIGNTMADSQVSGYLHILKRFVEGNYQLLEQESKRTNIQGKTEYWNITALGAIKDGMLHRFRGTSRNVTDRWRYLSKLDYQATHDSLTRLPNRTKIYSDIETALRQGHPQHKTALLIIDLDGFREINATLGHHTGDILLKQIGPRLQMEMDDIPGVVARLGGDEFAIFLSSIRNHQQAVIFAQRILDAISQAVSVEGMSTEVRASIGISHTPEQANDVDTLMRYAEVAMYHAKKEAIGIATYHQDHDPHSPKRLALINELGRAIREEQLALRYQPKIDFSNDRYCGFEALLCWNHPVLGLVMPGEFIPLIETTKLIQSVTNWVLERSIAQIKQWYDKGLSATIAVNLSARNLLDDEMVSNIASLLRRYNIPPHLLELEITEGAMMADPKRALLTLNAIHDLGVQLSVDDFGTGYSSLYYLKQLPVHALKIDASFVIGMLENEEDRIIVSSTIQLAHNLQLQVVAEGVESSAVAQALKRMDCDYGQGFYFGHPISEVEVDSWIQQTLRA